MAPVLVRGESGTGKELVARAIHACSHRAKARSSPSTAAPSRRRCWRPNFSVPRKARTPASAQDREGYFQAARGGTLFLDEIGDLPLAMQSKLLRAIQERRCGRSARRRKTRSTCASSAPPTGSGSRSAGWPVPAGPVLSAQRDRDSAAAAARAPRGPAGPVRRAAHPSRTTPACRRPRCLPRCCSTGAHPLPGNVRELENLLHRAVALGDGEGLQLDLAGEPTRHATVAAAGETEAGVAAWRRAQTPRSAEPTPVPRPEDVPAVPRPAALPRSAASARSWFARCAKAASTAPRPHAAAGPELAADPLPHCAAGHQHAAQRRRAADGDGAD